MKRIFIFSAFLSLSLSAYATDRVLIDQYLSPYAGSPDLLTLQHWLIRGEDIIFPDKTSQQNAALSIIGRSAEQFLVWYNIGNLTAVAQHEFFGHGYRLRQLGITPSYYYITPWGGATGFALPLSTPAGEETAITIAGLESEAIMARDIKMGWMRSGEIDGRTAATYTQAAQSLFWYTDITNHSKVDVDDVNSNDVASYIYQLNKTYPSQHYTRSGMEQLAYYNLIDPMTYYAYYAFFYYIGTGHSWTFPMLTVNGMKFMPNLRVGYAPYAPETYLENFVMIKGEPLYVYGKGGSRSYGAGAAYGKLWTYSKGDIGLKFDFWNQHQYITSATVYDLEFSSTAYRPELKDRIWGAAFSVTGTMKMSPEVNLYGELGLKSSGYLPGYSLSDEVVARMGLEF